MLLHRKKHFSDYKHFTAIKLGPAANNPPQSTTAITSKRITFYVEKIGDKYRWMIFDAKLNDPLKPILKEFCKKHNVNFMVSERMGKEQKII
jgi:hypothetical protein